MIEMTKTTELQIINDRIKGKLQRVLAYTKEARAAAETPEAKERRKQCEAERREWSLEIFNKKRWSRDEALIWIAYPDRHSLARSKRAAVLYDHDLPDREPSAVLTEAIADKRITEYTDGRRTWYRSAQVKAVFPELGLAKPAARTPRRRGRPPSVDWESVRIALYEKCREQGGAPSPEIGDGWNIQADAERFVQEMVGDRAEKTAVRDHVSEMLRDYEGR
jgi:hypothetical protein